MLCPVCGSDLPADSTFCAKCDVGPENRTNPPAVTALPTDLVLTPPDIPPAPAGIEPVGSVPKTTSYAPFTAQVLGLGLCLSVAALNAASNLSHAYWRVWPIAAIAAIVAIVLMLLIPGSWRKIEKADPEDGYPNKILKRCLLFVLILIATGVVVGTAIGRSGRQTAQLIGDFRDMSRLGKRISAARDSAERTVPAMIDMYESIRADVDDLDDVLHRLHDELPAYDDRFPNQHETTLKSMRAVETGLKRAQLLKQQIGVARDIEGLSVESRWRAWKERMEPLLETEDALDRN